MKFIFIYHENFDLELKLSSAYFFLKKATKTQQIDNVNNDNYQSNKYIIIHKSEYKKKNHLKKELMDLMDWLDIVFKSIPIIRPVQQNAMERLYIYC